MTNQALHKQGDSWLLTLNRESEMIPDWSSKYLYFNSCVGPIIVRYKINKISEKQGKLCKSRKKTAIVFNLDIYVHKVLPL